MKCIGCGADLSENATICPYCDTVVVPERNQKGEESFDSNAKSTFGAKIKNAIVSSWRKKDLFSKNCTIAAFLIALLIIVAIVAKNRGAIIIAILQIAALVVAVLMHKGTIGVQKRWIKYVVLGVAVLLSIANIACYSANKRPKIDATRPSIQSSGQKETKVFTPYSAKDCIGKAEEDIEKGFRQAGFTNIYKDVISDLEIEDAVKDGSIENITINGISDFSGNEEFLNTARIVIKYHSFKKIEAPIDSEIAKTTSAEELVRLFKAAGFVDITTSEVVDLDPDSTSEDFENEVTIDGISSFTHTANFPINATVKIATHKTYEKYTLKVNVDFVSNLIFSKYDVDLDVNGEITRLAHGEDGEFEYRLTPGKYTIAFTSAESSTVKGTADIELSGDTEVSYNIHCYNDKITVETINPENEIVVGEDEATIPMVGTDCKYRNYQEVEETFRNAGFTNISTEVLYDINDSEIRKEGEVERVTVNGETIFRRGTILKNDVPVIIMYHMKTEDDPDKQSSEINNATNEAGNNIGEETTTDDSILTKENNEDLAAILTAEYLSTDVQEAFVQKYKGKIIEFDCIVMTLIPEPKYNTIYSYILIPGEDESNIGAALFYIDRIGFYGFKWDKNTRPEFVTSGFKIKLRAKVTTGDDPNFIYLIPVKTWGREE